MSFMAVIAPVLGVVDVWPLGLVLLDDTVEPPAVVGVKPVDVAVLL